jgi:replicative DNA helicase
MIIIDYGDLLRPVVVRKEKRNELESIYEEMRGISTEFSCPVWTASQTNRSGLNAEVITMESISEAFSKCFVADLIFSVSRTIEDKQANTGRVFVAKNRNGPDGMVYPIFMDTSNVSIKFAPNMTNGVTNGNNTSSRPLNPVALTPQMQRDLLQQKYSSLRKPGSRKK